jgi:hypothetical protein
LGKRLLTKRERTWLTMVDLKKEGKIWWWRKPSRLLTTGAGGCARLPWVGRAALRCRLLAAVACGGCHRWWFEFRVKLVNREREEREGRMEMGFCLLEKKMTALARVYEIMSTLILVIIININFIIIIIIIIVIIIIIISRFISSHILIK